MTWLREGLEGLRNPVAPGSVQLADYVGEYGPRTVVLDVPYDFNVFQPLTLFFNTTATGQIFSTYQGLRVITDFGNTATLVSTSVLDIDKNVLNGATLESGNGFDYRSTSTAVPEPASVLLTSLGLAGVWLFRKRRRKALL